MSTPVHELLRVPINSLEVSSTEVYLLSAAILKGRHHGERGTLGTMTLGHMLLSDGGGKTQGGGRGAEMRRPPLYSSVSQTLNMESNESLA